MPVHPSAGWERWGGGHPGRAACSTAGMGVPGSWGRGQTPPCGSWSGALGCFGQGVPRTQGCSQPVPVAALGCAVPCCGSAAPRCRGAGSMAPLPPCRRRERGSVRPAAPLAGADVWLPGMKGLFRRASTLLRQETGAGGGQPAAGHTMPLCARHLGRLPWPPATVPTLGVQPGSGQRGVPVPHGELGALGGQGCRRVEGAGVPHVSPAPEIPGWGGHCPSSPHSPCPEPAGCPQPFPLPPTAPTGLASPAALERG